MTIYARSPHCWHSLIQFVFNALGQIIKVTPSKPPCNFAHSIAVLVLPVPHDHTNADLFRLRARNFFWWSYNPIYSNALAASSANWSSAASPSLSIFLTFSYCCFSTAIVFLIFCTFSSTPAASSTSSCLTTVKVI